MLSLMWFFYKDAVLYDPMKELDATEGSKGKKETKSDGKFERSWGKEIGEKNLFSKLRGKIPPPPPPPPLAPVLPLVKAEPEPKPEKPTLSLKGILPDESGELVALVERNNAKAVALRRGDFLEDILVLNVKERSVDLRWLDETITLSMEKVKMQHKKKIK